MLPGFSRDGQLKNFAAGPPCGRTNQFAACSQPRGGVLGENNRPVRTVAADALASRPGHRSKPEQSPKRPLGKDATSKCNVARVTLTFVKVRRYPQREFRSRGERAFSCPRASPRGGRRNAVRKLLAAAGIYAGVRRPGLPKPTSGATPVWSPRIGSRGLLFRWRATCFTSFLREACRTPMVEVATAGASVAPDSAGGGAGRCTIFRPARGGPTSGRAALQLATLRSN